jgi:hypothetical protein
VPELDPTDVESAIAATLFTLVDPATDDLAAVPPPWRAIAIAPDARTRRESALALWNDEFTALVPQFWRAFTAGVADVRVTTLSGYAALVYVGTDSAGEVVSWAGWDPGTFGAPPPFWEAFPEALKAFLHGVHAGFTAADHDFYGPMQPEMMETIASRAGEPDGFDGWDLIHEIPSTRLLVIGTDDGALLYCVSPDLPAGQIALVYEGDVDPKDLATEVDLLMLTPLDP